MAEVVAISLEVDAGKSVQQIKAVEKEISGLIDETNELRGINNQFKKELLELTQAYADMPKMALAGRKQLKSQMDSLKDSIKDNNNALQDFRLKKQQKQKLISDLKTIKQEGKNTTKALGDVAMSMASGYQAFIGVSALVGADNENLMKQLVKLQGVTTTLSAVEKLRNDLSKEGSTRKSLEIIKTKVLTAMTWLYNTAIAGTTGAMKLFRIALISTGLGALVVLLGVIIASFDKWKDTVLNFIKDSLSPLMDALKYLGIIESDLEKERRTNHENEMQRIQERRDALSSVRDKAEQDLKNEIAIANARGENTDKSQKKLLKLTRDNAQKRIDDNNALIEEIDNGNRVATEEEYENTQDSIIADRKLRDGASQDLKVFDATKSKERRDAGKVSSDKKTEAQKKEDELMLQLQRDLQDLIIANEKDEDVRELARLQLNQERALEDLRLKYGLETELEKELLIKQNTDLNELKQEIFLKNQEEGAKILEEILELEGEENPVIEKFENDSKTELDMLREKLEAGLITEKEFADKTQKIYDAKHLMRKADFDNVGSISNSLASIFAKNEKIQKANALVQIGIDTATAISALVAQAQGNPMNLVTGGLAGFAQLATGLASIAGNVAKAKQLLSGGGGSITGGSGVTPPSFDTSTINSRSTSGDGSGDGGNTIPTNRVVLVESDLRMMQERRNNSEIISTI